MEIKAQPRSVVQQRLGLSDEEFDRLVHYGAVEVLTPPDSQEQMVPDYALGRLLRKGTAALLREFERQTLEYAWNKDIAALLERRPEIRELMEQFLAYIRDNTSVSHFAPLRWSVRIRADARYASLTPTGRGLQLWVTRQGKQQTKLVETSSDFAEALQWIRTRNIPWPVKRTPRRKKEGQS